MLLAILNALTLASRSGFSTFITDTCGFGRWNILSRTCVIFLTVAPLAPIINAGLSANIVTLVPIGVCTMSTPLYLALANCFARYSSIIVFCMACFMKYFLIKTMPLPHLFNDDLNMTAHFILRTRPAVSPGHPSLYYHAFMGCHMFYPELLNVKSFDISVILNVSQ